MLSSLINTTVVFSQWNTKTAPGQYAADQLTITSSEGSVGGTNNYTAFCGPGNDIVDNAGYIGQAFNTIPAANLFKAKAGKPVKITIEFIWTHFIPDYNTIVYDYQNLAAGIGKNEQGYAYDQYFNIPNISITNLGYSQRYSYEVQVTFPVGRTQAWIVFPYLVSRSVSGGPFTTYRGTVVLPFVVEGPFVPADYPISILGYTKEPSIPYMVLHNPPGDNSTVTFATNQEACRNLVETASDASSNTGRLDVTLGIAGSTGLFVTVDFEFSVTASASVGGGSTSITTKEQRNCVSVLNAITTAPSSAGAGNGSVFIGYSTTLAYGIYPYIKISSVSPVVIEKDTGVVFAPVDKLPFFWTKQQIKNDIVAKQNLINTLGGSANDIKIKNESLNQIKLWQQVLVQDSLNTYNPNNEVLTPPFELSGGIAIDNSKTVTTSTVTSYEVTHYIEASVGLSAVVKMGGSGIEGGYEFKTTKTFGGSIANSNNSSTTIAYHLYDDDEGDVFPMKIVRDPSYGTPIFVLSNGAKSSWPYEGGYQRDQPSLRFSANLQSNTYTVPNVPVGTTSQFGIKLCNNSNETRTYNLRFNPQSNANNALISVSGTVGNTEFGAFTIPPNTCNPNTFFVNVSQQNLGALSSPNLNMELYPANDQNISSDLFATVNWGNYSLPLNIATDKKEVCTGSNVSLSANCPAGIVTWYDASENGNELGTGSPFAHNPANNMSYFVSCQSGIYNYSRVLATSVLVGSPEVSLNLTNDFTNGNNLRIAQLDLTASNKIISPAGAVYMAGKSVTLMPGFEARIGSLFKTEIKGCN